MLNVNWLQQTKHCLATEKYWFLIGWGR